MNRMKKEELRKYKEARAGLSAHEIKLLDEKEAQENRLSKLIGSVHFELFPEEYDFQYDSVLDAKERAQGINPMSPEYISKVDERRLALGVAPFSHKPENGQVDSWTKAREEALKQWEILRDK
jgi:hypothetical protein